MRKSRSVLIQNTDRHLEMDGLGMSGTPSFMQGESSALILSKLGHN